MGPLWDRLAKPLWVARRVLGLEKKAYDYYDFEVLIDGRPENNRFFILRYPASSTQPYLDATWANIERVAEQVRSAGSEFALVVMPRYFHWNDEECPDNWEKDRYGVDEPYENAYLEDMDRRQATADFPVWSLLSEFEKAPPPLVFSHDPHWNDNGHKTAGEALATWLRDDGWPGQLERRMRPSFPQAPQPELTDLESAASGATESAAAAPRTPE